jgi:hypothetical protein
LGSLPNCAGRYFSQYVYKFLSPNYNNKTEAAATKIITATTKQQQQQQ